MRRLKLAVVAAMLATIAIAAPASAITNNYTKDFEHTYVGLVVFYDEAGEFSHRCSGSLLTPYVFLTAGHCFDRQSPGWQRPRINGSSEVIPSDEIARNMHVNFNFQFDPFGNPRPEVRHAIVELIENRLGSLDFAIVRLAGQPGQQFGNALIAEEDADEGEMLCIIGHPAGVPKRIEAGLSDVPCREPTPTPGSPRSRTRRRSPTTPCTRRSGCRSG